METPVRMESFKGSRARGWSSRRVSGTQGPGARKNQEKAIASEVAARRGRSPIYFLLNCQHEVVVFRPRYNNRNRRPPPPTWGFYVEGDPRRTLDDVTSAAGMLQKRVSCFAYDGYRSGPRFFPKNVMGGGGGSSRGKSSCCCLVSAWEIADALPRLVLSFVSLLWKSIILRRDW